MDAKIAGNLDGAENAPDTDLDVEVAYATPQRQLIVKLRVAPGTTVAGAIDASAIRGQFPEIEPLPVTGIFSRKVPLDHVLAGGDRVEIYRPLLADPKDARRAKVEVARAARKKHG